MATTVLFHQHGGPDVLTLADLPVGTPGPGELRLRIDAIGLNRAEVLWRDGNYIETVARFPARLGTEAAGTVDAVGDGVTGFAPGQAVSVIPAFSQNDYAVYADHALVPASAVIPRPDTVGAVDGAAVWMPYLTAYGALAGTLAPGDTLVVTAASSSVGLAALRVARRLGATPIAVTRTDAKKATLLAHGAAHVITTDTQDVAAAILDLTHGRGTDHTFDAVAGPGVTDLARATAPGGSVIVYGALSGQPTPFPGIDLGLPALTLRTFTVHEITRDPELLRRAHAFVTEGLRAGDFQAVVDRTFPLTAIADAHRHLESGTQIGKIVATVDH